MVKQEIRKHVCGSLNEWEYWALFENGIMISPWLLSIERAQKFQELYNKGVKVCDIDCYVPIDFVNKSYQRCDFDRDKEDSMLAAREKKTKERVEEGK